MDDDIHYWYQVELQKNSIIEILLLWYQLNSNQIA